MSWQRVANNCECCEEPDADCPASDCSGANCLTLPVDYDLTGYVYDNTAGSGCSGICEDLNLTIESEVKTCFGCPWCEGGSDCSYCGWCYGSMTETGHFPACTNAFCNQCYSDAYYTDDRSTTMESPCPQAGWGTFVDFGGYMDAPDTHTDEVDLESIFTAYSVTYDASAMGSSLLTGNYGLDLCSVWGHAFTNRLYIKYIYETNHLGQWGGCRTYCFRTNEGLQTSYYVASAGDHINWVNAQTTGSGSNDLGLTASGSAPPLMYSPYGIPSDGIWVRLDGTGASVDVKSYQPPSVYMTFEGSLYTDPYSCDFPFSGFNWTMKSDTKRRTHTGVYWDEAYCPYSYSWTVTDMGENIEHIDCSFTSA